MNLATLLTDNYIETFADAIIKVGNSRSGWYAENGHAPTSSIGLSSYIRIKEDLESKKTEFVFRNNTRKYEKEFQKVMIQYFKDQEKEALSLVSKSYYPLDSTEQMLVPGIGLARVLPKKRKVIQKADNPFAGWSYKDSKWNKRLQKEGSKFISSLYEKEGSRVWKELSYKITDGLEGAFDIENPLVQEYISNYSYKFAQGVNEYTVGMLQGAMTTGMSEGLGMDGISKLIMDVFDTCTKYRSLLIARTETIRASNGGAEAAYMQSGVVEGKEWLVTEDDKTCPLCNRMAGKVKRLNENYFSLGDKLVAEGTTMIFDYEDVSFPPLHPSCRCTILPVIKETYRPKYFGLGSIIKVGTARSGNRGHGGRPGKVGGSTLSTASAASASAFEVGDKMPNSSQSKKWASQYQEEYNNNPDFRAAVHTAVLFAGGGFKEVAAVERFMDRGTLPEFGEVSYSLVPNSQMPEGSKRKVGDSTPINEITIGETVHPLAEYPGNPFFTDLEASTSSIKDSGETLAAGIKEMNRAYNDSLPISVPLYRGMIISTTTSSYVSREREMIQEGFYNSDSASQRQEREMSITRYERKAAAEQKILNIKTGDVLDLDSFTSFTTKSSIAAAFSQGKNSGQGARGKDRFAKSVVIEVSPGAKGLGISRFSKWNQSEVITKGSFKVESVIQEKDIYNMDSTRIVVSQMQGEKAAKRITKDFSYMFGFFPALSLELSPEGLESKTIELFEIKYPGLSTILKGGHGSGILGHRTIRAEKAKYQNSMEGLFGDLYTEFYSSDISKSKKFSEICKTFSKYISETSGKTVSDKEAGDMVSAIQRYAGSIDIYRKVREGKEPKTSNAIESLISNSQKFDGKIYRGMSFSDNSFVSKLKEGSTIDMNGFSSWSSDSKHSIKFASRDKIGVMFQMKNKSGVSITHLSRDFSEKEVLLSGQAKIKVNKVEQKKIGTKTYYIIEAEESDLLSKVFVFRVDQQQTNSTPTPEKKNPVSLEDKWENDQDLISILAKKDLGLSTILKRAEILASRN